MELGNIGSRTPSAGTWQAWPDRAAKDVEGMWRWSTAPTYVQDGWWDHDFVLKTMGFHILHDSKQTKDLDIPWHQKVAKNQIAAFGYPPARLLPPRCRACHLELGRAFCVQSDSRLSSDQTMGASTGWVPSISHGEPQDFSITSHHPTSSTLAYWGTIFWAHFFFAKKCAAWKMLHCCMPPKLMRHVAGRSRGHHPAGL